jgi:hypothetical protein
MILLLDVAAGVTVLYLVLRWWAARAAERRAREQDWGA